MPWRGLLRRLVDSRHWASGQRERAALRNRESLQDRYGIGRGEAASLVLAERYRVDVIYLSPAGLAYDAARCEGVRSIAIRDAMAA